MFSTSFPAPAISKAAAVVSRRGSERLRSGHVWVYRSDVISTDIESSRGELCSILDGAGRFLGTGLWSPSSEIALRLVSTEELSREQWLGIVRERLRAALARRELLLDEYTSSCRLVFSEADGLPGLVIDRYGDMVILQILTAGLSNPEITSAVIEELTGNIDGLQSIYERPDPRIRELESLPPPQAGPLWRSPDLVQADLSRTEFRLNGLRFLFDVNAGQKTGAFLDQRQNYLLAARYGRGEALDVCTYQGGFALHLATVCRSVTGLDSSRAALEVAEQNLSLNQAQLGRADVEWVQGDAFAVLREWSDSGAAYDTIVLDPPAFAKSKRAAEGALRGYKELNLRALKMLKPGGTLITCSCSHHISFDAFQSVVTAAAGDAGRRLRLLERAGAAPDHPVVLNIPETEYLKCFVLEVES